MNTKDIQSQRIETEMGPQRFKDKKEEPQLFDIIVDKPELYTFKKHPFLVDERDLKIPKELLLSIV
jgi:hypothetical protein